MPDGGPAEGRGRLPMREVRPPGDKSISHRVLLLAPLARGTSRLHGLQRGADVQATAAALRDLGIEVPEVRGEELVVPGPARFRDPTATLDCGNSGTTARLLVGLIAGLGLGARLDGDASLRRRPMDRVVYPLQAMGARIEYEGEAARLPVRVRPRASGGLRPLRHRTRVASAQVKSCLLLAGLAARIRVEVCEPGRSRDHTERLLASMGAPLSFGPEGKGARVRFDPEGWDGRLAPLEMTVPGDPSAAAFLVVAALLNGRPLRVREVSLNPTRTAWLEVLREMGAEVHAFPDGRTEGEPVGDLVVRPGALRGFDVGADRIPRLLDEVPVLAVLAARAVGVSRLAGASELRVKESDRLAALARNLEGLGVTCRELPDGLEIEGKAETLSGRAVTGGDHRIAMAFGALGRAPGCRIEVDDPDCADVSYPGFWEDLAAVTGERT